MLKEGKKLGRIGDAGIRKRRINLLLPSCAFWPSPSLSPVRAIRLPACSDCQKFDEQNKKSVSIARFALTLSVAAVAAPPV